MSKHVMSPLPGKPPPHTHVILNWSLILLLIAGISLITLVASGFFDPKPIGTTQFQMVPTAQTISKQGPKIQWLETPLSGSVFTVRVTAVFPDGTQKNIEGGLLLGTPEQHLAVRVSPLGYAAVQVNNADVFPWQPWPHVHTNQNEIWVDVRETAVTVRVNREQMWSGTVTLPWQQIGTTVAGRETATVDWQTLTLFHP